MSQYAEQIGFGGGTLIGTQIGTAVATPRRFGILQDVSLDFSADLKELYGQNRYAIALAPGKTKVELKAKFAGIRGGLWNDLYFGATTQTSVTNFTDSEIATAAASTFTVANAATFQADQGLFYSATGLPLVRVASAPTAGQYAVSAMGVYTVSATDATAVFSISYTYTATGGVMIPITNIRMGVGPNFKVALTQPFDGRQATYTFNNCQSSKLSLPSKQDDYQISELDFMVAADPSGNIGTINLSL